MYIGTPSSSPLSFSVNSPTLSRAIEVIRTPFDVSMHLPGSKSIILRQLVISALAREPTTLHGCTYSEDVETMVECLRALNVRIEMNQGVCTVDPIHMDWKEAVQLDARQSGLSLRLLLGISALRSGETHFVGDTSLQLRPQKELLDAIRSLGCDVDGTNDTLPITVRGGSAGGTIELDTTVSSQYLSALLISGPRFDHGLKIQLKGSQVSSSYIDITINEMYRRGYTPERTNFGFWVSPGEYNGEEVAIEGDASAASYFAALATLHGSRIRFMNLGSTSRQGDCQFFDLCSRIGARTNWTEETTTIEGSEFLKGVGSVDMVEMPDAALTMMALAPYLPTRTTIKGLASLPFKECNRIACPAKELRKTGVNVLEGNDHISIEPVQLAGSSFETYQDHRMAMAFAVFASKTPDCSIVSPDCVNKTYPKFWADFDALYG